MRERLLNYSHHLRRLRMMVLVAVLAVPIGAAGQLKDPNDALNLDFKDGLAGWKLYHGVVKYGGDIQTHKFCWNYDQAVDADAIMDNVKSAEHEFKTGYGSSGSGKTNNLKGKVMTFKVADIFSGGVSGSDEGENCVYGSGDYYWSSFDAWKGDESFAPYRRFNVYTKGSTVEKDINFGVGNSIPGSSTTDNNDCKDTKIDVTGGFARTCRLGTNYGIKSGVGCELQYYGKHQGPSSAWNQSQNDILEEHVASAEMMEYEFVCTEQMGMLVVDYCAIAMNPKGHEGDVVGKPLYYIKAECYDENSSKWNAITCGSTVKNTSDMLRCDGTKGSKGENNDVVTTNWENVAFNLTEKNTKGEYKYRGKKIRIQAYVTDCCYDYNKDVQDAGGHACYMYFRAEVKPLNLDVKYCSSSDPVEAIAPSGYDYYEWKLCDEAGNVKEVFGNVETNDGGKPSGLLSETVTEPTATDVEYNSATQTLKLTPGGDGLAYERIQVRMSTKASPTCFAYLDTLVTPTNLNPIVGVYRDCNGDVVLKDESVVGGGLKGSGASDFVNSWTWRIYKPGFDPYVDGVKIAAGSGYKDNDVVGANSHYADGVAISYSSVINKKPVFRDVNNSAGGVERTYTSIDTVKHKFAAEGQWVMLEVKTKSGCEGYYYAFIRPRYTPVNTFKIDDYCEYSDIYGKILNVPAKYADYAKIDAAYLLNANQVPDASMVESINAKSYYDGLYIDYLANDLAYSFDSVVWTKDKNEIKVEDYANVSRGLRTKKFWVRDGGVNDVKYCYYNVETDYTVKKVPVALPAANGSFAIVPVGSEVKPMANGNVMVRTYEIGVCGGIDASVHFECDDKYKLEWPNKEFPDDDMIYSNLLAGSYPSKDYSLTGTNNGTGIKTYVVTADDGSCKSQVVIDVTQKSSAASVQTTETCYPGPATAYLVGNDLTVSVWGVRGEPGGSDVKLIAGNFDKFEQAVVDFDATYYVMGTDGKGCSFDVPFNFKQKAPAEPLLDFYYHKTGTAATKIEPNAGVVGNTNFKIDYNAATGTYVFSPLCGHLSGGNDNRIDVKFTNNSSGEDACLLRYEWYKNGVADASGSVDKQHRGKTNNKTLYPTRSEREVVDKYRLVVTSLDIVSEEELCQREYFFEVHSMPVPKITVLAKNESDVASSYYCEGELVTIVAEASTANPNISTDFSYTWTHDLGAEKGTVIAASDGEFSFVARKEGHDETVKYTSSTASQAYDLHYYSYKVMVEDAAGCVNLATVQAYIKPRPKAAIPEVVVCQESDALLIAEDLSEAPAVNNKYSYNDSRIKGYKWENNSFSYGADANQYTKNNVKVEAEGLLMVPLEIEANNGCKNSIVASVGIYDSVTGLDIKVVDAGGNELDPDKICSGTEIALKISAEGAYNSDEFTYQISRGNETSYGEATTVMSGLDYVSEYFTMKQTYQAEQKEIFKIKVVTSDGCEKEFKYELKINPAPRVAIQSSLNKDFVCDGGNGLELTATASVNGEGDIVALDWVGLTGGGNGTNDKITGTVNYVPTSDYSTYTAVATTDAGCKGEATKNIYNGRKPVFEVEAVPSEICEGKALNTVLTASSKQNNTYFEIKDANGVWLPWNGGTLDNGSQSTYTVSSGSVMANVIEKWVVRAGNAYYGPDYTPKTGFESNSNHFCYSEVAVEVKPVILPKVKLNVPTSVCRGGVYNVEISTSHTEPSNQMIVGELFLNGEKIEDVVLAENNANDPEEISVVSNGISVDKLEFRWKYGNIECEGLEAASVAVNPLPTVKLTAKGTALKSGDNVTVCEGESVDFKATLVAGNGSYSWERNGSVVGTDANYSANFALTDDGKILKLSARDGQCSAAPISVTINVEEAPKFTASLTQAGVCEGCKDSIIISDDADLAKGYTYQVYNYVGGQRDGDAISGGKEYEVEEVDENNAAEKVTRRYYLFELNGITQNAEYEVVAKNATGCETSKIVSVVANKIPVLDIQMVDAGGNKHQHTDGVFPAVCKNELVTFEIINQSNNNTSVYTNYKMRRVTAGKVANYTVKSAAGTNVTTTPALKSDMRHRYEITAVTDDGCEAVVYVEVPIKSNVDLKTLGNHADMGYSYLCRDKNDNADNGFVYVDPTTGKHFYQIYLDRTNDLELAEQSWTIKIGDLTTVSGKGYNNMKIDLDPLYSEHGSSLSRRPKETSETLTVEVTDNQGCKVPATHVLRLIPDPDFDLIMHEETPNPVCFEKGSVEVVINNTETETLKDVSRVYHSLTTSGGVGAETSNKVKERVSLGAVGADNKYAIDLHAGYVMQGAHKYADKRMVCKSSERVFVDVTYNPDFDVVMKNYAGNDISGNKLCIGDEFYFEMTNGRKNYQGDIDYAVYELWYDADKNLNEKLVANVRGGFGSPIATNRKLFVADSTKRYKIVAKANDACSEVVKYLGVDVDKPFKVNVSGPLSMCSGSTAVLSAPTGYTAYKWYANGQPIVSNETSQVYTISNGGTYSVKVQNANLCWSDLSEGFTVEEHKLPVLGQPEGLSACIGSVAEVKAKVTNDVAVKSFEWYKLDASGNRVGNALTDSDGKSDVLTVPVTGNVAHYEYVAISDHCASVPEKFDVIGLSLPDIQVSKRDANGNINTTLTTCAGTSLTLNAVDKNSPSTKFIWLDNNGDTLSKSDVWVVEKPMDVRQVHFKVKAIDTKGCVNTVPFVYDVLTVPNLDIDGQTACQGISSELKVSDINEDLSKPTTYLWTGGVTGNIYNLTNLAATNKVQVTATHGNGCTKDSLVEIVANALPEASISVVSRECNEVKLKANTSVADVVWYVGSYDENNNLVWVKDANGNNKPHYQNQDVISVVVDKKMAYQIYVQDGTCSKVSDVFDLDHYATPSFDIADVEVCQGESATLTAQNISGVDNFFWSDKREDPAFTDKLGDGISLVVTPSESLSEAYYSVYGTNMNRCTTDVKTVKVTVHAKPKVLLATANGGPSMRCLNDQNPLKLKASVGVGHDAKKIQWNNVGGYKDVTAGEDLLLDYKNSASSTVYVSIEDQNQCIGDTFITVTVVANPKITVQQPNDPFCAGEMAKLSAQVQFNTPATKATCEWKDQAGNMIGNQTDHFVRLPDNNSGENFPLALTYTVEATDDMSCKSDATVTLEVKARPTITVSGEKMICPNTDAVLTLGGADYFYVDESDPISGKAPSYREVLSRPHTFEVYGSTVYGSTVECISDKMTFEVKVKPAPVIAIEETGKGLGDNLQGQTRNACEGDNLSLKAKASGGSGSGYVYAWGLNNTDFEDNAEKGLQLTGRQDNAYKTYVYAKDGDGCIAETWVEFIANPLPVAYIKSDRDAVCDVTEEVVLKACNDPNATFENCQGFPGNIEYEWSYTKAGVNKGLGNKSEAIVSDVDGKVTVNLKVTDVNNLCFSNVTKDIDKNELPQFTVKNGQTDIFADNNGVVKICEGAYADLVAVQDGGNVALSGTTWSYYSNGQMVTADGAFFQTNAFDKGTSDVQYKVTVDGTNGCSATKDFKISVKPLPTITIRGPLDPATKLPTTACFGSDVEFRAVSEYNEVDFTWTSPQNKPGDVLEFTAGQLGNTVVVTAKLDGCVNTAQLEYDVHHAPDISIESSAKKTDNTVCEGSYVKLMPKNNTVSSQNKVTWVWTETESGKEVSLNDVCEIPNLFKTTKYTLTGVERGVGCEATAQVTINVKAKPIIGAYFKSGDKRGDTICSNATDVRLALSNDATYYMMSGGSVFNDYSAEEIKSDDVITDFVAGMRNEYTIRAFAEKEYDAGGTLTCTADTTIGLTVFAAPTVSIAAANVYCPDQEIKMTALGADEYEWGGLGIEGLKESSVKVTPESYNDTLSFSVTGTKVVYKKGDDEFKCSTTVTKDVEVLDKYDLKIEAQKSTVCYGDKAVLKVLYDEGDYTKFYWSTYQSGETTEKLIMSASQFITVEATDRNKCRVKDSIEIKGQDPDNFNFVITNPTPIEVCENDPLVLKVSGAGRDSHVWDFDPTVTTNQLAVPTKSNGIYRVKGTLEECTKELVIPVTVKAAPAIAISGDVIVCRDGTLDLKASSVVPELQLQFQWNAPDNAADPAEPWHLILNDVSKDESYKVTAISTDPTVCKAEEVVKVKVRENPKVSIEGDNTVCNNTYADLTATGAVNYVWGYYDANGVKQNNKGGGDNYQPKVGDADLKVFVTGYDAYNCVDSVDFDIRSVPTPKFDIVTDNGVDVVCEDEFVKLKASANSQVTDVVWNGKDTFAAGTLYHSAPLKNSREFYAMGYSEEGCAAYATKEIKVLRKPVIAINGNTTLCQNDMLKVKAIGADSYTWGTGQSSGNNNEFMEVVMNEPGTKQISVTGLVIDPATQKTCPSTGVFDIVVKKTPVVRIEAEDQTCANVALPLKAVTDDEDVTSFTWSNDVDEKFNLSGQDIKAVIADKDVWFTVSAGTSYGCVGTARHLVDVVSSPTFEIASNIDFGKPMGDGKLEFNDLGIAYVDVCDGSKLNLQIVSGANTFKWNHREKVDTNFTSLDTTIATSATFVVTGYITGCEASRTIVVNHKNNPVIDVVGKRVVCEGSLVTLEPIGADSFLWRGDAVVPDENGKKVISFVPTSNEAKYVLLGIDTTTNCQTSRTYADIKFTSKPEFTVSGDRYVCVNESIVLNAFAVDPANDEENYSYNWGFDKDAKRAIDLDSELEITAFEAGVDKYFASVKDSVGCVDTLFFEVTKKPLPTLTFDAKGSDNDPSTPEIIDICMKNDLYAYINSGGASVTQENGKVSSTIKDKPVKDTIYKVTGTLNGCVNTLEIPVRTIPSPIVYLTNYAEDEELTYCEGSPVKLVVGGNAVSYIMPDGTKGANGATYVDEKADGLMTYFITGEGDNGCSVQEEFSFKMNALPEVAIDIEKDQDRICYREVAELHVTGAESYTWSTGSHKDTIKATITKDSLFTVVGKDGNGCEREVSFKVTMVELPVLAYKGDTEFCDGNTATLRGSGTGVGGGDYYAWSIGKDTIAMGNLATTTLNGNTTYTLWGKSKEGCVSSLDVDITAKEAPILFWEGEYELNETADSILLCQKQTLDITMKGADTYQWTGGSTTDRLTVVPTRSTHYTVTGTGANGCKTTQAINVKVLPTPTIKIDAPTFACVGEDFQMKVTDDTKDNFGSFAWSNHSTEATSGDLTMTEEDYTLKVTGYTSLNCPAEASFTVKPKALPKLYVRGTKEICKGGVFSLHGQGANTYAWFMDENDYYGNDTAKVGDQISFEAATDEVLVMSGTLNGCTDTIHVPLSVQTPPILHTEGLKPICQGEVLELIAKATNVNEEDKVEFSWSAGSVSGELGDTMRMTPLSSQEIYLTGSVVLLDENGEQIYCKNTLEIPVTVNAKPTIEVEGERTVCYGTEAKFTAVGAAAYEWVELESSSETVRPIITSDTSLTVRGKDTETSCDAEAVVKVKVKPLPVLGVANGSKVILCDGEEADITVFGAATYGWRQPDGSLVAGNRYKHTPEQDTIYRVIGTSNNNCVDSMDIEVTVNMLPSLSYSGDSEICSGDSLILFGHSAPEGCTFSWSNGDNGDKMEAKPLVSATYTLTGKDGNGCVTSMEIPVVVNQRTPLNLAGTSNVCAGSQAEVYVVDAEGFTAFNWSNGNVGENIKPHVSEKTTFTAEGIDVNGCVTKAEFTVNVTEIPVLSFHGDTVVCLGEEVSLLADGAGMYNWRDVDGNLLSDKARYTFKPDVETKLILEGYMSNCKAEREIPIMVNAVPNLEVDMPEFICRGSVGELRATAGAGVTFEWSTGETEKVIEVAPNKSTYYTVTATNEHGCDSTVKRTVLVVEPPKVLMGTSKDMVCPDQADSVYFSATGAVSYEWSSVPAVADIDIYNSDKQNFRAVLNEGVDVAVTVVGTDEKGCETKVTKIIAQRELEPMQFVINPNCIDESNPEVRFAGKIPDHESAVWTWTPGEGLDPVTARNNTAGGLVYKYDLPLKDSFEVKVRSVDEHGCIQEGSGWVYKWKDFWAAEAFTPDGDGLNDKFMFHGGDFIENFTYVIYNRMGEVIFEGKGIEDEWDGNYKGEPCPTGVYGWTVRYDNNSATLSKKGERKGSVTIVR